MSVISEALSALRSALNVTADLKQIAETLQGINVEIRDQDRRITRLEAKWEAAVELSAVRRPSVPRLKDKG